MKTKLLMELSALLMATLGLSLLFLPQELAEGLGVPAVRSLVLAAQVTGALYLSFAVLNWTARANLIGGIYSKPVALANFSHFSVVSASLAKAVLSGALLHPVSIIFAVYMIFAIWFGFVLFAHPLK